ncbi:MAG: SapC family protein [Gammaproteobacteria bacterium]|nr:SapC family protein [Gammaproteobacteria bacterium]
MSEESKEIVKPPMFRGMPVLLDTASHADAKVKLIGNYHFADGFTCYLSFPELYEACKEYVVTFTKGTDGEVVPITILGMRQGENVYVRKDGSWDARYIPAYIRRYPFGLAELAGGGGAVNDASSDEATEETPLGLILDEDVLSGVEGESLFDEKGEATPFLQQYINLLQVFQGERGQTVRACALMEEKGLFKEFNLELKDSQGHLMSLTGMMMVDGERFDALSGDDLKELRDVGAIPMIYAHLFSQSNTQLFAERYARYVDENPRSQEATH